MFQRCVEGGFKDAPNAARPYGNLNYCSRPNSNPQSEGEEWEADGWAMNRWKDGDGTCEEGFRRFFSHIKKGAVSKNVQRSSETLKRTEV